MVDMSSSRMNRVQELRFSETAGKRKNVDGLPPIIPQREENRTKSESQFNLRNSFAWDSDFFTSPGILDPEELFEALKSEKLDPEMNSRVAECNSRRSLAWDSGFFTSAGFLDQEELSKVNQGYRKSEARLLPGIDEDFLKSTESDSTVSSELSLASLEIDLFDHIKASSVHKSSKESSTSVPTSRKADASSRRIEMPASRKHSVKAHSKEKIAIVPRVEAPARKGESNSTIKRAFLGANSEKSEHKIRKGASGQNVSKELPFGVDSALTPSPRSASSAGSDKSANKSFSNSLRRKTYSKLAGKSPSLSPLGSIDRSSGGLLASMNQIANDSKGISKGIGSGNLKLSGLRMPLPKIGFFDMEKPALAPDGNLKFHTGAGAQTTSKGRSSIDRGLNRGKGSKSQLPRTSIWTGRMKLSSASISLDIKPASLTNLEAKSPYQKLSHNGDDSKTDSLRPDSKNDEGKLSPVSCDGKENVCSFKEEVDNLSRSIEAIDFSCDLAIEL